MKEDNRSICSDGKKAAIKATRLATAIRRQEQICKVYECKIVKKRLNTRQKEEFKLLFLEGKRFYNHVLNLHQNGKNLNDINSSEIKNVEYFSKDKQKTSAKLNVIGS